VGAELREKSYAAQPGDKTHFKRPYLNTV